MSMLRRLAAWIDGIDRAINIEDLRRIARRRLPRILFDYIDGGEGVNPVCAEICRPSRPTASGRDISSMCPNGARDAALDRSYSAPFESARSAHRIVSSNGECLLAQARSRRASLRVVRCEHRIDRSGCRGCPGRMCGFSSTRRAIRRSLWTWSRRAEASGDGASW